MNKLIEKEGKKEVRLCPVILADITLTMLEILGRPQPA
jgi:hypothetical protein